MSETLVPVFIPPLADLLAHAERSAQRPLTPEEVEQVRDGGACMMMSAEDAEALVQTRGFRDVHPQDAWADWHRLRAQKTSGMLPRLVLCFPVAEDLVAQASLLAEANGATGEVAAAHPGLANSFLATHAPLTSDELQAIQGHQRVVYWVGPSMTAASAVPCTRSLLEGARALLEKGAYGLKIESSGAAHPLARWHTLLADLSTENLLHSVVCSPIGSATELYSCGMHLLGRPDFVASRDEIGEHDAYFLFLTLGHYLIEECVDRRHFADRSTFQPTPESPRWRARWEPCVGYEADDFYFNPFGRWRLSKA